MGALIRLNEPVPLWIEDPKMSTAIPICLPWSINDPSRNLKETTSVIVTGWGVTFGNETLSKLIFERYGAWSAKLHKAKIPIASSKCTSKKGRFEIDPDLQYCAG